MEDRVNFLFFCGMRERVGYCDSRKWHERGIARESIFLIYGTRERYLGICFSFMAKIEIRVIYFDFAARGKETRGICYSFENR